MDVTIKHLGPGNHPNGTPQEVHAGGDADSNVVSFPGGGSATGSSIGKIGDGAEVYKVDRFDDFGKNRSGILIVSMRGNDKGSVYYSQGNQAHSQIAELLGRSIDDYVRFSWSRTDGQLQADRMYAASLDTDEGLDNIYSALDTLAHRRVPPSIRVLITSGRTGSGAISTTVKKIELDKLRIFVDFAIMHCERKSITLPLDMLIGYAQAFKTLAYFERVMRRLVQTLYDGQIGGEFVEIAQNLISGQMRRAYEEAWKDDGNEGPLPDYLRQAAEAEAQRQMEFVSPYYRAIVDARVDGTPVAPLLNRVDGWTHQYDVAKREAVRLMGIENGVKQKWIKGETEHGCQTCADLDGLILYAKEWQALGVHPRGYPNPMLDCQGGGPVNNCDCDLVATDQRRTPKGYELVMNIMTARKI